MAANERPNDAQKLAAAREAVKLITPGMRLGLGTGSTAAHFIAALGERARGGLDVVGVATSTATAKLAASAGVRLASLDDEPHLDLTVDGADEIDPALNLIKGGGGALLREKMVAMASERMLVIADAGKKVRMLGAFPLPVEVVQFAPKATAGVIRALAAEVGCKGEVRLRNGVDGKPFVSENGNFILDCAFGRIARPQDLAEALSIIPGVVEHGLFIGLCDEALIAGPSGVERLTVDFDDDENGEEDAS